MDNLLDTVRATARKYNLSHIGPLVLGPMVMPTSSDLCADCKHPNGEHPNNGACEKYQPYRLCATCGQRERPVSVMACGCKKEVCDAK
jgi:hypothetical protein